MADEMRRGAEEKIMAGEAEKTAAEETRPAILADPGSLIALQAEKSLADLIKPLTREIHLFDTYIAGTASLKDKSVLEAVAVGDRLILQREDNKFDEKAILILNEKRQKLGYVPERDNVVFARLMDAGKMLTARVTNKEERGTFTKIRVGILMVEF